MGKNDRKYVGVDVGGTKILALLVTGEGEVLDRCKRPTTQDGTPLAEQIEGAIDTLLAESGVRASDVAGLGIAVPGVVDSQTGLFVNAPNIAVDDHRLVDRLAARYPAPVTIGNDVNLGTLAEAVLGAGRGASTVVGVFVGTGIGGGVVIDGRVHTGAGDQGGEIGHMVLIVDGPPCGCGNLGCWEAIASRTAIEREIRKAIDAGRPTVLADFAGEDRIRSGPLGKALKNDDPVARDVMTRVGHYLAQGALTIKHILDPDVIIFGGGVIEACDNFLMPIIEQEVRADRLKASRDALRLVVSELGDDAVALGAAVFVRSEVEGVRAGAEKPKKAAAAAACCESAEARPVVYPRLDNVSFGAATVDGKELPHDIYIRADGKLGKRKKRKARKKYGTSHVIDAEELQKVCKGGPKTVIVGAGFQGMVRLSEDGQQYLEGLGVDFKVLPTPEAAQAFGQADGPKALLLHVTC